MQFALAAIVASAAVLVGAAPQPRESCPDTAQFGVLTVSPTAVKAGDASDTLSRDKLQLNMRKHQTLTVNADFSCAINTFNVNPEYTDYYIDVPDCGNESPIFK
ncbi:hypothetical protein HD554DRAFT_2299655 [Boletus coccyginus]|nr:hypothetical protein HD554DRAFT_2299655 [Boletus coccyginus]